MAWYSSELFGKATALARGIQSQDDKKGNENNARKGEADGDEGEASLSREEAIARLKSDYEEKYFVTGRMSMDLYEEDCEFADPFVSFRGRARFKENVSNLGSFMEEVTLKLVEWKESEDGKEVMVKWRFSCVLGLPWRPILAASGNTTHSFNPDNWRIFKHVEVWDISPMDGLKQLVKPNPRLKERE